MLEECPSLGHPQTSGPEKGVITKGVFPLEESLESLKSLDSLQSLENGRILLCLPQSEGSQKSLKSLNCLESLEIDFSEKTPFPKDPYKLENNLSTVFLWFLRLFLAFQGYF